MRPLRRRREAQARAEAAAREVEKSRERLAETREKVVAPLIAAGQRNSFADLIRASLVTGHSQGRRT